MMVLDRKQQTIDHRRFVELPRFVRPGDLLVLNDTRVRSRDVFRRRGNRVSLSGATRPEALALPGQAGTHNADRSHDQSSTEWVSEWRRSARKVSGSLG